MPHSPFIPPSVPVLQKAPPNGPFWQHEVKFDGYRLQVHKHADGVTMYSKNGADYTKRYAAIARAAAELPAKTVILDGELIAVDAEGKIKFRTLHLDRSASVLFIAFDILEINGVDLRVHPLARRRSRLVSFMGKVKEQPILLSETFDDPAGLLAACGHHALEGVVSKRVDRPYHSGTCRHWVKVKCPQWREAHSERHKLFEKQ